MISLDDVVLLLREVLNRPDQDYSTVYACGMAIGKLRELEAELIYENQKKGRYTKEAVAFNERI